MNTQKQTHPVNATIPVDILAQMDAYIASQEARPTRSAVIVAALSRFLEKADG